MEQIINNNNDEIIKPHEQNFLDDISKNGRFCLSIDLMFYILEGIRWCSSICLWSEL